MAGIHVTGNFNQTLTRDYHKVFFDVYNRHPDQWMQVAKVLNHAEHQYKEGQIAGIGALQEIDQGGALPYETFVEGNDKEVTFTKFGLGLQFTEEAIEDDLTGNLKKGTQELGKACAYTKELEYWDMLNSGFVTTYRTGLDGQALFSDAHPLVNSASTIDNNSTSSLSQTSLEAGINYFDNLVNESNVPLYMKPKVLIVPPALRWKAKELLESELKPEGAENDLNVLKGEGIKYMVVNYLTSDTAWFLLSDEHDLRFIWRKQPQFQVQDDFNTGNKLFKVSMRITTDFWDYRGVYGSSGA